MKKFFLFVAAAMTAMTMSAAHSLNNPVGADGRYVVKYDLKTNTFAESNDMKVNETFVFAVDVTGTWLETFLNGTPTAEGAQRGIAINKWTSLGDVNGDTNRMKRISGNIWGMTVNYWQIATGDFSKALMEDSTLYVSGQIFGFEYTADNPGANWWMWEDQPVDVTLAEGSDCLFAFALSTATTAEEGDEEFYSTDYMELMYGYDVKGYAAPCAKIGTDILVHNLTGWDALYLYMRGDGGNDLGGAWPGFAAQRADEDGVYFLVAEGEYDGKSENLIFNNGNGVQLADYPITLGDSYELWVTLDGVYSEEPSALPTVKSKAAAAKRIVDGQMVIEKENVRYNVLGGIVK